MTRNSTLLAINRMSRPVNINSSVSFHSDDTEFGAFCKNDMWFHRPMTCHAMPSQNLDACQAEILRVFFTPILSEFDIRFHSVG